MAITTNSELNTAVANWLSRSDLTSRIPEFIALFEAKFNRDMRVPQQERRNESFSVNAEYVSVPTDFLELRAMFITSSGTRYPINQMPPSQESEFYSSGTGVPRFVSVSGHTTADGTMAFRFAPPPDGTYTATIVYYAKLPALNSTTQTTNWLLTSHPDAYLYGSLLEASIFIGDDPRIPMWKAAYDRAMGSLNRSASRSRWSSTGLAVRPM